MRSVVGLWVTAAVLTVAFLGWGRVLAQPDANPTAVAIQTEVANLEASLTAMAEQETAASPVATPVASPVATPVASPVAAPVGGNADYQGFTLACAGGERTAALDYADPPLGVYIVARYEVTNNGLAPATLSYRDLGLTLRDGQGRTFSLNTTGTISVQVTGSNYTSEEYQPGLTAPTGVAFDVPTDAANVVLVIGAANLECPLGF